jgi:hypothetical protein
MIDKVSRLAERVATGMSRRQFVSWVGRGGLSLATLLAGVGVARSGLPVGVVSCVLNGGCCGGDFPYLRTNIYGQQECCKYATCNIGLVCAPSPACCNGAGYCGHGTSSRPMACYSDRNFCTVPCS